MKTKNLILILFLSVLGFFAQAQGLDNIYVERYYVSDANDNTLGSPGVPIGSVTYRIYVDLAAGCKLSTVYGSATDNLVMGTTTTFYNSADYGNSTPGFSAGNAKKNVTMIDSWITFGQACVNFNGIPKAEDDGVLNFVNANVPQLLQNNAALAGIPLTVQDGMLAGTNPALTTIGIPAAAFAVIGDGSANGPEFRLTNGSWASLGGALGLGASNRILIAQMTTDGTFNLQLNMTIKLADATTVTYVASTPQAGELTHPSLTQTFYPTLQLPVVNLTAPLNGSTTAPGAPITFTATASDLDGSVTQVEFFRQQAPAAPVSIGLGLLSAGVYSFTALTGFPDGDYTITAKATDNDLQVATSAPITITVGNAPPVATMTAPANGTVYIVGDNVTVSATAVDPDGTVASLKFYNNGVLIPGTVTFASGVYSQGFTTTVLGANALTAKATDNLGKEGPASAARTITVNANQLPVVAITAPVNGATPALADPLVLTATATDPDPSGSISLVQFFNGATLLGNGALTAGVYTLTVPAASLVAGPMELTAKATDNKAGVTTSNPAVNVTITNFDDAYAITFISQECNVASVCMPISTVSAVQASDSVNGYNFAVQYDITKVAPTGNITVSTDLISAAILNGNLAEYVTDYTTSIDPVAGIINIAIYFNANAGLIPFFAGTGDVCCVEFNRAGIGSADVAIFSFDEIYESYRHKAAATREGSEGNLTSFADNNFAGSLKFWSDLSPIVYNSAPGFTNQYLITNITKCGQTTPAVQPDMFGNFTYLFASANDTLIDVKRDIHDTTNVHPVITGQDSYITALVSVKGELYPGWQPLVYQMIAMDVNRDGLVTAGDATQINQRAVSDIYHYNQLGGVERDWSFVMNSEVASNPGYLISTGVNGYPEDDGIGYSKYRVPVVAICQDITKTGADCPVILDENLIGIMIGDVDGTYTTAAIGGGVKSATADTSKITIDLSKATFNGTLMSIPVSLTAAEVVHSFDFDLTINDLVASVQSVESQYNIDYTWNYIAAAKRLSVAAFSLNAIPVDNTISIVLNILTSEPVTSSDLIGTLSLVNGLVANMDIVDATTGIVDSKTAMIQVYPNPASDVLNVEVSENAKIQLLDLNGKQVIAEQNVNANQKQSINVSNLANGVYMVKVYNDEFVNMKKVVIKK